MANMVLADKGKLIFDPFVGTGSILVAAASMGAVCMGTDIENNVLHGKADGTNTNVFSNFDQYGLPHPELIRADNSLYSGHFRTHCELYDGIVTDPPYGVRFVLSSTI